MYISIVLTFENKKYNNKIFIIYTWISSLVRMYLKVILLLLLLLS